MPRYQQASPAEKTVLSRSGFLRLTLIVLLLRLFRFETSHAPYQVNVGGGETDNVKNAHLF
jgi:hypothetical protein